MNDSARFKSRGRVVSLVMGVVTVSVLYWLLTGGELHQFILSNEEAAFLWLGFTVAAMCLAPGLTIVASGRSVLVDGPIEAPKPTG